MFQSPNPVWRALAAIFSWFEFLHWKKQQLVSSPCDAAQRAVQSNSGVSLVVLFPRCALCVHAVDLCSGVPRFRWTGGQAAEREAFWIMDSPPAVFGPVSSWFWQFSAEEKFAFNFLDVSRWVEAVLASSLGGYTQFHPVLPPLQSNNNYRTTYEA